MGKKLTYNEVAERSSSTIRIKCIRTHKYYYWKDYYFKYVEYTVGTIRSRCQVKAFNKKHWKLLIS